MKGGGLGGKPFATLDRELLEVFEEDARIELPPTSAARVPTEETGGTRGSRRRKLTDGQKTKN